MRKKVLLVSCDVYRPAAIDQLRTLAAQLDVDFFPVDAEQKPVAIARAALDYARKHYYDVMIVDTAGRLAIDEAMMAGDPRAARGARSRSRRCSWSTPCRARTRSTSPRPSARRCR